VTAHQAIEPLDEATRVDLDAKRKWVADHYEPHARNNYETVDGKLNLLTGIIASGWIEPHEVVKWQSLGATFGDALAQELMLEWVKVEDEYGIDAALIWPGTSLLCFPLTMISKRIERGEEIVVREMFDGVCGMLKKRAFGATAV
jgi:hypothetical protein